MHACEPQRRLILRAPQNRFQDVLYFKGGDLKGNDNVVIADGSLMPRSPAAEAEKMSAAWQAGMLNPMNPRTGTQAPKHQ